MVAVNDSMARLRWRCRRGTREMELLLRRFLERDYPHLAPRQQSLFGALLDEADPNLYAWISGRSEPPNPDYLPLIDAINSRSDAANARVDRPAPAGNRPGDCPPSSNRDEC